MNKTWYDDLLKMSYAEICKKLKEKYGIPKHSYFYNNIKWNKNNEITRTKEGLYIHHQDEDKFIMLGEKIFAKTVSWDYQQADRLIYCNIVEHLLLHIKIVEFPNPISANIAVGIGGVVNFIVPQLNDIYSGIVYKLLWMENCRKVVLPLKEEYIKILKYGVEKVGLNGKLLHSFAKIFDSNWVEENNEGLYTELRKRIIFTDINLGIEIPKSKEYSIEQLNLIKKLKGEKND